MMMMMMMMMMTMMFDGCYLIIHSLFDYRIGDHRHRLDNHQPHFTVYYNDHDHSLFEKGYSTKLY